MTAKVVSWLFAPRPIWLLLGTSIFFGVAYASTMLPVGTIAGTGPFWEFPHGTVPGSENDMAEVLVGYLFLQHAPWGWPPLYVPHLGVPAGTNVFWLDAVPWVSLSSKLLATAIDSEVNVLGLYLFACFVLPGVGMTLLLAAARQRNLLVAVGGTLLANAMPFLLFRWGHVATQAQFLIVFALALYIAQRRAPHAILLVLAWLGLLGLTCLTNPYLVVMGGACWSAALGQRSVDGSIGTRRVVAEAVATVMPVVCIMVAAGILNAGVAAAGSYDFGVFSMNLASPVTPQMSGLLPSVSPESLGTGQQYEGYAWLGTGMLLLVAVAAFAACKSLPDLVRSHSVLLFVLTCCFLFALSNRIWLGHHLLLTTPVPDAVLHMLGAFRSSGRFFWLVGYALLAFALLTVARRYTPMAILAIVTTASILQLIDVIPLHRAIAQTAGVPRSAVLDRSAVAVLVAHANEVFVFPSFSCVDQTLPSQMLGTSLEDGLLQANMELQLAAAHLDRPINSVYVARLPVDCAAEQHLRDLALRPDAAYVYLLPFVPTSAQLHGHNAADVCQPLGWARVCLITAH